VRWTNADKSRFVNRQYRAVWDDCIKPGNNFVPPDLWALAYLDFHKFLRDKTFGWFGVNTKTAQDITAVTQLPSGQVQVTVANPLFTVTAPSTPVQARVAGVLGAVSFNGSHILIPTSTTVAVTKARLPILPYTGGPGRVTLASQVFIPFDTGNVLRASTRNTGRQLFSTAGRRRARRLA
jgi:hypothetical protein